MKTRLIMILLLPLFMSCKIGNENIPLPTPSPSIQPSPSPTESLEPSPTVTPTVIPSSPLPTSRFSPGSTIIDDIQPIAVITGRVYDQDGELVSGAKVESRFSRPNEIITQGGEYTLNGVFVIKYFTLESYNEIEGEISVSKEGYKTVTRKIIVENPHQPPPVNIFNFGGVGEEAKYALVKIE